MRTLLLVVLVAACSASDRREAPTQSTTPPSLTKATQMDLAKELDDAAELGTWAELKRRWTGQQLRWNVVRQRALCASAEACNVAPFAVQRGAKHGWLPELDLAPGQFAVIEAQCGARETCDLTIEGTLDKIEASDELPTNLHFTNVRIVTQTALR